MTITETQKTAQLAADAAVSAAEAKQYMLEAEQGYQDTSAAAQQAQDAAGSALLSKQSAATSEENSLQYATEAGVARDEAVTAASNASEYAQNKFTFFKTPSDPDGTIAGLAATTEGQSFWVAQGPNALSSAWQYQNVAGVAVLQAKQPGTAAVTGTIREFPTLTAAQSDTDAGNILSGGYCWVRNTVDTTLADEYINNSGTLEATGRKMPSSMPTGYQAATAVSSGAANTIAITIPGLLIDGSLIYFSSPILNTGAVNVTVTDARGNSVVRAIQKQNNAALVGNELLLNQPVLMEFRTGTANNFILVASGPVGAELNARLQSVERNSIAIVSAVAMTSDAYTGITANTTQSTVLVTGRVFVFTPSATNTTRTPTLSLNGWTARTIKQASGTNLAVGDLVSGYPYLVMYNAAATDFRLLTYPADRSRLLNAYARAVVTSDTSSPNAISLTIPGLLGDGTQLTFEPVVANTGATTLVITDMYGNSVTRTLLKGANTALTGGELKYAQPVTVQYRGGSVNNFKLLYSGDPTTDIQNLKTSVTALQSSISDPYSALATKLVGTGTASDQSPFGTITWSSGVKTVTKRQIICTSVGSSVGVGAGSTGGGVAGAPYAPNTLFVNALKTELAQYGEFDIVDDNQCIPTQAFQQFAAQLANSPYSTSDFVLIVGGMNDAPVGNFNMGRTFPGQKTTLESLIDLCLARGAIPIVCTTPHHNVEMSATYPTIPGGNPLLWPVRTFNVSGTYAFNSTSKTITQAYFANPSYGGDIFKAGMTIRVESGNNAGNYTISAISSDRTVITVNEPIPETSSYSTTVRHFNLAGIIEDVLYPAPSESFVTKDWTGGGVMVQGDIRFEMVNNMQRSVARQKGAFLADCAYSFFKYGVEVGGYGSVYDVPAGNYNHMNDNGYNVTFGYTLKLAARKISALIFGEKYYYAS